MKTTLLEKVKADILRNNLIKTGDSILVAVSGGMDSVCLLHLLLSLRDVFSIHLSVAHVNHMLRGAESDRDEAFVRKLCEKYDIPFYLKKADVKKIADAQKQSIEEAGRSVRYDFFRDIQKQYHISKIATAHNKDDNVETVCMRFMRGTGIHGLGGIPIANNFGVIRPLLHTSREEIEGYITVSALPYVTDSSNLCDDYTRNQIRHHVIPYIEKHFNHNFKETLSDNIALYDETESFMELYTESVIYKYIRKEFYGFSAKISHLLQEHPAIAKRMIRITLSKLTGTSVPNKTVQNLYESMHNKNSFSVDISANVAVHISYDTIYFYQKDFTEKTSYSISIEQGTGEISFADKHTIYLKPTLDKNKITVRKKMPGDRIYLGNCGHKKLKDLLIDEKVPAFIRDTIPMVLYENEVIWVCGIRDNPLYRATPGEAYIKLTHIQKEN